MAGCKTPVEEMELLNLPVPISAEDAENERTVRRDFWRKLIAVLGRIPFVEDLLTAYFCTRDPATPGWVRAILVGALAYFILPADMIPDLLPGVGFTDDATVLLAAVQAVASHIRPRHREAAKRVLDRGLDAGVAQ